MTLRNDIARLAAEHPELQRHLNPLIRSASRPKQAGGFSVPLMPGNKVLITARQIKAAMAKEGGFDLDYFDFSKIEYDPAVEKDPHIHDFPHNWIATWRVFPKGEFGNRASEYVWGTVGVGLAVTPQGITATATLYVRV